MKRMCLVALVACSALAGCGGGGGGGGTPNPPTIPLGTFKSGSDRTTAPAAFTANVVGAFASANTVYVYGAERDGTDTSYTYRRWLTLTLYGPVQSGSTYTITAGATHPSGTAQAAYVESAKQGTQYVTTGSWQATGGSVTVTETNGSHIQGTFTVTATNSTSGNTVHFTTGQFNTSWDVQPPGLP